MARSNCPPISPLIPLTCPELEKPARPTPHAQSPLPTPAPRRPRPRGLAFPGIRRYRGNVRRPHAAGRRHGASKRHPVSRRPRHHPGLGLHLAAVLGADRARRVRRGPGEAALASRQRGAACPQTCRAGDGEGPAVRRGARRHLRARAHPRFRRHAPRRRGRPGARGLSRRLVHRRRHRLLRGLRTGRRRGALRRFAHRGEPRQLVDRRQHPGPLVGPRLGREPDPLRQRPSRPVARHRPRADGRLRDEVAVLDRALGSQHDVRPDGGRTRGTQRPLLRHAGEHPAVPVARARPLTHGAALRRRAALRLRHLLGHVPGPGQLRRGRSQRNA